MGKRGERERENVRGMGESGKTGHDSVSGEMREEMESGKTYLTKLFLKIIFLF